MKNSKKKIISSIIIFAVTILAGFGITAISFNLFDNLSQNQMRILFAADIVILLFIGTVAWFLCESQKNVRKKNVKKQSKQLNPINSTFDFSNFAA